MAAVDIFKSQEMKHEFNKLIYQIIPSLNECRNCNVLKCHYCVKFSSTCNSCRLWKCKNCFLYKKTKEILMEYCLNEAWENIANFLTDFFKISDTSIDFFNLPPITGNVREKNHVFVSERKLRKHLASIKYYDNNDRMNYIFKGRKYWRLSGRVVKY